MTDTMVLERPITEVLAEPFVQAACGQPQALAWNIGTATRNMDSTSAAGVTSALKSTITTTITRHPARMVAEDPALAAIGSETALA